jgi:hypothetical protein
MATDLKRLTTRLTELGVEGVAHTGKTYMGHLVNVYRLMEKHGCSEELCRAGMFHSIYGTQQFQGFKVPLAQRSEIQALIGDRAERLAYLNCALDRPSLDRSVEQGTELSTIIDRLTGAEVRLSREDFDDLCAVHLYDWLEQVARSRLGWGYRRSAYRGMAERLGSQALAAYDEVFKQEPAGTANA